jgi:hypothetical protein
MRKTSKQLLKEINPILDIADENGTIDEKTVDYLYDLLMDHFKYKEFPMRWNSKIMKLGYLVQQLVNEAK